MLLISSWMMHGLADAGAAEQADLAALQVRRQQIDHLDAGDQDFRRGRLFLEASAHRGGSGSACVVLTGPCSSIGSPITFRMRPSVSGPTGTVIGAAGVHHFLAAHHAVGAVHGDAAHGALAQFLRHFQHQGVVGELGVQRVLDERQLAVELHVHHGAHHLGHASDDVACHVLSLLPIKRLRRRR